MNHSQIFEFELGEILEDKISGFRGVVVARVQYLNGNRQYGLQPFAEDSSKLPEIEYIGHNRLQLYTGLVDEQ